MRDGSIGSWVCVAISPVDEVGRSVRGFVAISPSRGGDEDGDLTGEDVLQVECA